MGQVPEMKISPPTYLLIGSGRLALHLKYYFSALGLNFFCWSRNNNSLFNTISPEQFPDPEKRLADLTAKSSHILLLIQDSNIEDFINLHPLLNQKILIHCSGALSLPTVHSAHPLMTFTHELYPLEVYLQMSFITEIGKKSFHQLFPQLANPNFMIKPELKPLYHALCVLGGNASSLIWQQVLRDMKSILGIPANHLSPYMECIFKNILTAPEKAVTGPIARRDWLTIEKNLSALKGHKLESIYKDLLQLTLENFSHLTPSPIKEELC